MVKAHPSALPFLRPCRPSAELRLGHRSLYIIPSRFGALWTASACLLLLVAIQTSSNSTLLLGFLMLGLMFLSIPVAVAIIGVGPLGGYAFYGLPLVDAMGGVLGTSFNSPSILAIPLFMLLGELLLRGGIANKMFDAFAVWLDRLPGGLLHTNLATCALFSATSGSSVATAATVGTIALPALDRRGYAASASLGSPAAGGTLGILIPPSINHLVYG